MRSLYRAKRRRDGLPLSSQCQQLRSTRRRLYHCYIRGLIHSPAAGLERLSCRHLGTRNSFCRSYGSHPSCAAHCPSMYYRNHMAIQYFSCRLRQISFEIGHFGIQCGVLPRRSSESTLATVCCNCKRTLSLLRCWSSTSKTAAHPRNYTALLCIARLPMAIVACMTE